MNVLFDSFLSIGGVAAFGLALFGFLGFCAAILLAVSVKRDVERRAEREAVIFLFGADAWGFVVFASGGFPGAMAYWLIHYSALRYSPHVPARSAEEKFRPPLTKSRVE